MISKKNILFYCRDLRLNKMNIVIRKKNVVKIGRHNNYGINYICGKVHNIHFSTGKSYILTIRQSKVKIIEYIPHRYLIDIFQK